MPAKLRVAVIFGGRSGEHEVSLMSSHSILSVLDPQRYQVFQVGITQQGAWLTGASPAVDVWGALKNGKTGHLIHAVLLPEAGKSALYGLMAGKLEPISELDVVFPVLHGTFGEDGTLQGLLELADLAYVGSGVLGSAVGMDKALFKDVMRANNIPVAEAVLVTRQEIEEDATGVIQRVEALDYPVFTKPANLGSSVGITRCRGRADLHEGLMEAARFDRRVIVEKGVPNAREVEVSVLGNENPEVSVPGEILPADEYYSYEAKYLMENSRLLIPADLPAAVTERVQELAVKAYLAADCAGMARVDFLVDNETGQVYLNELNTIPGFTKISMYPKLWEASGLPYGKLVDRLIDLALERKDVRDHTERQFRRGM